MREHGCGMHPCARLQVTAWVCSNLSVIKPHLAMSNSSVLCKPFSSKLLNSCTSTGASSSHNMRSSGILFMPVGIFPPNQTMAVRQNATLNRYIYLQYGLSHLSLACVCELGNRTCLQKTSIAEHFLFTPYTIRPHGMCMRGLQRTLCAIATACLAATAWLRSSSLSF